MGSDTLMLHLTQLERKFRRIKPQLRKLFNLHRLVIRDTNPNLSMDHVTIINGINILIRIMILDIRIYLNFYSERAKAMKMEMGDSW